MNGERWSGRLKKEMMEESEATQWNLSPRFFDRPACLYLRSASWPPNACPTKGKIETTARGSRPPLDLYLFPARIYMYIYIDLSLSRLFRQSGHLDIRGYLVAWPVRKIVQHGQSFRLRNGLDKPHSWKPFYEFSYESNIQLDAPYFSVYVHLTCYKITRCALLIIRCYRYSSHSGWHDTVRKVWWEKHVTAFQFDGMIDVDLFVWEGKRDLFIDPRGTKIWNIFWKNISS